MTKAKTKGKAKTKSANPNGRPPMFKTAEELQAKIDEYFKTGRNVRGVVVGRGGNLKVVDIPLITITGLALYLGFCDRQSLYDMEKLPKFSCIIKRARCRVENSYEELTQVGNNPAGPIFCLKNMGWKDKTETVHDITNNLADFLKAMKDE